MAAVPFAPTRSAQRRGGFTAARVVALVVMGLLTAGLLYLALAPGDSVSVPDGAQAGNLTLEPCTYEGYSADCGTLVVPENRADPASRLIALPITRVKTTAPDPGLPVFRLQGGPGVTNMAFTSVDLLADSQDVVLVGYRGVEGSSVLACPDQKRFARDSGFHAEDSEQED